jgi:hypothetical protein
MKSDLVMMIIVILKKLKIYNIGINNMKINLKKLIKEEINKQFIGLLDIKDDKLYQKTEKFYNNLNIKDAKEFIELIKNISDEQYDKGFRAGKNEMSSFYEDDEY